MVVPPPAGMFVKKLAGAFRQMDMTRFAGAFGGESFTKGFSLYGCRWGVPFTRAKGTKTRSRGTGSPLTNPFLSLAVLDTDLDFSPTKNLNPYCAQIRSKGSHRRICPLPTSPPLRGRGTPSLSLQTDSPANHNHRPAPRFLASPSILQTIDCRSDFIRLSAPLPRFGGGGGRNGQMHFCAQAMLRPAGGCTAASSQTAGHSRRPERRL